MNKIKALLILIVILLGVWFIFSVKELHFLMKKYPTAFHQSEGFSFTQFYNTYDTLSFSEVMIKKGETSSSHCRFLGLEEEEMARLAPLVSREYYIYTRFKSEATHFKNLGARCLVGAKLIDFKLKDNRAYATFSCEQEDLVQELVVFQKVC